MLSAGKLQAPPFIQTAAPVSSQDGAAYRNWRFAFARKLLHNQTALGSSSIPEQSIHSL
jgi:hypothetical protein